MAQLSLVRLIRPVSFACAGGVLLCSVLVTTGQTQTKAKPKPVTFERNVLPVVIKYCGDCHSGKDASAGLDLIKVKTQAQFLASRDSWQKVAEYVSSGHMPPKGTPQPVAAVRTAFSNAINTLLNATCNIKDPGRVTLRRLNRAEYNNTIRDLVGVTFQPADDFPSDDVGYGFDNIGDVLSISPLLMEKYVAAAEQIAERAIVINANKPLVVRPSDLEGTAGMTDVDGMREFFSNGVATAKPKLPKAGLYRLRITTFGDQAGPAAPALEVKIDEKVTSVFDVTAVKAKPAVYEIPFSAGAEPPKISLAFLNDFYDAKLPVEKRDRNLFISGIEIVGPLDGDQGLPVSHRRIMTVQPEKGKERDAAKKILTTFANRAFRRPVEAAEVDRLLHLFDLTQQAKEPFERGIQLGVTAVLVSPSFLFRVESDANPKDTKTRPLGAYEMANRLSYFLWSSMPDDRLRALAANGTLIKPAVLATEVKRMLADPKARALADNFAEQWLQLRKLHGFNPAVAQYPAWNDELRESMFEETKLFFQYVLEQDRSVYDFLDAKYSFINEPLAKLYGIPGVTGPDFRKVSLVKTPRAGVLTQASVLAITSNPTRTSPTKRGKWVLENILGTPPPPPPPGVGDLGDATTVLTASTLRKRMEQHRTNPSCAVCHDRIDPLGFGMENFDPIGRWRTKEGTSAIDSTGVLPDGRTFKGPVELRTILLGQKKKFLQTLADRLLTYGLGRGLEGYDKCAIDDIVARTEKSGDRFSALVTAIVQSDPFRKRRGETAK